MLTLDLAIVTYRPEGIERVARMKLPRVPGVRYIVSWQEDGGAPVPPPLRRDDVEVFRHDRPGISSNRNNAIARCRADIVLLADDDITFGEDNLEAVRLTFENNPDVDVATFRSVKHGGTVYPASATQLRQPLPKGYSVTSFEIALRRSTAGGLRCCTELGLGSPRLHGGEDEILLLTALKRGLRCMYFPVTVCEHPHPSTGTKARLTAGNLEAAGCVIALYYPLSCILRVPLIAVRHARGGRASLFRALLHLSRGALSAPGLLRRNRPALW